MERYGVEWLQKGTHEKHLSVLEFERKERAREVAELDSQKKEISSVVTQLGEAVSVKKQELKNVTVEKTDRGGYAKDKRRKCCGTAGEGSIACK